MARDYPGQSSDEITLFVVHKHWSAVAPFLFVGVLILCMSFGTLYYSSSNFIKNQNVVSASAVSSGGFIGVIIAVLFFIAVIGIWRANKLVVTDKHLVDIDQIGLFNRKMSILNLGTIQDISTEVKGPLQTMLRYGTILVQTASEQKNFIFDYVPDTYETERRIHEVHQRYKSQATNPPAQPQNDVGDKNPLDQL